MKRPVLDHMIRQTQLFMGRQTWSEKLCIRAYGENVTLKYVSSDIEEEPKIDLDDLPSTKYTLYYAGYFKNEFPDEETKDVKIVFSVPEDGTTNSYDVEISNTTIGDTDGQLYLCPK